MLSTKGKKKKRKTKGTEAQIDTYVQAYMHTNTNNVGFISKILSIPKSFFQNKTKHTSRSSTHFPPNTSHFPIYPPKTLTQKHPKQIQTFPNLLCSWLFELFLLLHEGKFDYAFCIYPICEALKCQIRKVKQLCGRFFVFVLACQRLKTDCITMLRCCSAW